ncbi:MAG: hypothetical protein QOI76_4298 [Frankiales bacterium]|jgi:hypothetical protein|nr:hypothetical protein [Frankiales bacterium]
MTPNLEQPAIDLQHDAGRIRSLFAAHAAGVRPTGGLAEQLSRLTGELIGAEISLPAELPVWHHVHRSSRELRRVPYDGCVLVVHNTEPAGSSFLVFSEDGQPHSRRGPALTLHRPEDVGHDDLLVVFAADLDY